MRCLSLHACSAISIYSVWNLILTDGEAMSCTSALRGDDTTHNLPIVIALFAVVVVVVVAAAAAVHNASTHGETSWNTMMMKNVLTCSLSVVVVVAVAVAAASPFQRHTNAT